MIEILTPPTQRVVALEDLKGLMHIAHDRADETLTKMLDMAQDHVENRLRLKLLTQTVRLQVPNHHPGRMRGQFLSDAGQLNMAQARTARESVRLGIGPLQNIQRLCHKLTSGESREVPLDTVHLIVRGVRADIVLPTVETGRYEIDLVVGYGDTPDAVPSSLRLAIMLLAQSYAQGHSEDLQSLNRLLAPFLNRGV